tara:strand:- start:409 stop:630 length:222 start_codon:yes stop_codon:yes gene_type:complete
MMTTLEHFLANLTDERAEKLIAKFDYSPAAADAKSEDAYYAFCASWELLYPDEYIQRHQGGTGGTRYHIISVN